MSLGSGVDFQGLRAVKDVQVVHLDVAASRTLDDVTVFMIAPDRVDRHTEPRLAIDVK